MKKYISGAASGGGDACAGGGDGAPLAVAVDAGFFCDVSDDASAAGSAGSGFCSFFFSVVFV